VAGGVWGGVLNVAFILRDEIRQQAKNESITWKFIGDSLHIEKAIWQGVQELRQETLDIIESTNREIPHTLISFDALGE
jgi:hypothetical protein